MPAEPRSHGVLACIRLLLTGTSVNCGPKWNFPFGCGSEKRLKCLDSQGLKPLPSCTSNAALKRRSSTGRAQSFVKALLFHEAAQSFITGHLFQKAATKLCQSAPGRNECQLRPKWNFPFGCGSEKRLKCLDPQGLKPLPSCTSNAALKRRSSTRRPESFITVPRFHKAAQSFKTTPALKCRSSKSEIGQGTLQNRTA
jgi:hypothetical protein